MWCCALAVGGCWSPCLGLHWGLCTPSSLPLLWVCRAPSALGAAGMCPAPLGGVARLAEESREAEMLCLGVVLVCLTTNQRFS